MALFGKKEKKDNPYLNAYNNKYSEDTPVDAEFVVESAEPASATKVFGKSKKTLLQEENDLLRAKVDELSSLMTPELQELHKVKQETERLHRLTLEEQNKLSSLKQKNHIYEQQLKTLQNDIIVAEESIELESFSIYKPRWEFAKADDYKNKLREITDSQKAMIKNGTAAYGNMGWTVNNSNAKGKKLVRDMMKLCLRSFNNECDAAVSAVRFNNYDRCENRIRKSADSVAKLGSMMDVGISHAYIRLKIKELQLALEYQIKKQEEKDRLRELKAQEREEARALKEMEAARKIAEKEQTHYSNALSQIEAKLATAKDETEKSLLLEKKTEIESHLIQIEENIRDLDYRYSNRRAGYVYIISNIGAFGENIYKIGMTRRLDPQERVDELGDASVPFRFDVHAMIFSDDAPALEAALHKEFENKKVNMINNRKEFFNVTLDEIKTVVHKNHDKVVEFTDIAPADQYRESLKMKR